MKRKVTQSSFLFISSFISRNLPTPPSRVKRTLRFLLDLTTYVQRGRVGGGLQAAYSGPYRVLGHAGKVYELQVGERVEKVAADRLKPHLGSAPAVARPPPRGRPLGTSGSG